MKKLSILFTLCLAVATLVYFNVQQDTGNALTAAAPAKSETIDGPEEEEKMPNDWMYAQRAYPNNEFSLKKYREGLEQTKIAKSLTSSNVDWQQAGPINIGGRITDIAIDPTVMDTYYAGSSVGGVYKTVDSGENWSPVFDNSGGSLSIGSIGISPSNPQVLYVGTGEANGSATSGAFFGNGVYKTTNGGNTWAAAGLENSQHIGRIVVNPQDENEVYAAVAGQLYNKSEEKGLFKSTDGGQNWNKIFYLSDSTSCIDVAIHPTNPNIVYACMWERTRMPWQRDYGGVTSGIHRSTDGGQTWQQLTNGLPPSDEETGRIGIVISPSNPDILYSVWTTNSITNVYDGIFRSDDGGDSWYETPTMDISSVFASFGWFFGNVRVSPADPDIVFILGQVLLRSMDGGQTWEDVTWLHVDQHGMEIHPLDPDVVIAGNDGGIYISGNIGTSWQHVTTVANTQFYNVEIDPIEPNYLFGGTQDNNTIRTDGALDGYDRILGGDGFHVRVDPDLNNFVYAEYQWGNLRRSEDHGDSFNFATEGIQNNDRNNWNSPFTIDPNSPNILYFGTNRLYKTEDRALQWFPISADLTKGQHPSGSQSYGTLSTVAVCPTNSAFIATGSDDGRVHVSSDAGGNFVDVSAGLPDQYITTVAFHTTDPNTVFVTLSGYRKTDYLPHVFRSTDLGQTWTDISANLPEIPVNDIIIDPMDPDNVYYLANDLGTWTSSNAGLSWEVLGTNMPTVIVNDLAFDEETRKLAAGTFGRSMFTMIVPDLMVSNKEVIAANDLNVYPNPARNQVTVAFSLEETAKGSVQLFDIKGNLVQHIGSRDFVVGKNELRIDRGQLVAGTYIVRLVVGDAVVTKEVIFI